MSKNFRIKAFVNKKNNQINLNLPRKKLPQAFVDKLKKNPNMKLDFMLKGW